MGSTCSCRRRWCQQSGQGADAILSICIPRCIGNADIACSHLLPPLLSASTRVLCPNLLHASCPVGCRKLMETHRPCSQGAYRRLRNSTQPHWSALATCVIWISGQFWAWQRTSVTLCATQLCALPGAAAALGSSCLQVLPATCCQGRAVIGIRKCGERIRRDIAKRCKDTTAAGRLQERAA